MEFVHRCHFCGWERAAGSPTILQPGCQQCGSLLDSGRPDDFAPERTIEPQLSLGVRLPSRVTSALKGAALTTLLFTATATGLQAGGPWVALGAFAAAGLATTPALVRD